MYLSTSPEFRGKSTLRMELSKHKFWPFVSEIKVTRHKQLPIGGVITLEYKDLSTTET